VNGWGYKGSFSLRSDGSLPLCADCCTKLTVPCAFCGKPILIGYPITLYVKKKSYTPPPGAICYDGPVFMGCMRCAVTSLDRAGYWLPVDDADTLMGHVVRVPNLLEVIADAMQNGNLDEETKETE
jgi:hypothetical protein